MKVGSCLLIKQQDKWRCVKYHHHDNKYLYFVAMPKEMQYKRNIQKVKFDPEMFRSIHQGKGEKVIKNADPIQW